METTILMRGDLGATITNTIISDTPIDGGGGNDVIVSPDGNNSVSGGAGDDILVGSEDNDTLNGGEGNDIIAGVGGNDSLLGEEGNDTITGGGVSFINDSLFVTEDASGMDTLTGGIGEDLFVLGGQSSPLSAEGETVIIHYDEAGNDDYALITDFNAIEDTINLGGATSDYHLGSPPTNLPAGTALYRGDELIAIIQGSSPLSLDESYFQGSI